MSVLPALTTRAADGPLPAAELGVAVAALVAADEPAEHKEAFLVALARRGEHPSEVATLAAEFRARARDPGLADLAGEAIDVCGTGGDHAGSFNVSTAVTLLLAAAGVKVFKHGNRSITSRCGSAELLGALGVPLEATPDQLRRSLDELGFAFFFAPAFHPAFKEIMPVRRALAARGQRTVFNLLGPLINPGRPAHQLLGVFAEAWVEPLATALDTLGLRRALVVHGRHAAGGIDEWTTATDNLYAGAGELREERGVSTAAAAGLPAGTLAELAGGGVEENLALLEALAAGAAPAALADTVALNAGAALWVADCAADLADGVGQAQALLRDGALARKLAAVRAFYAA
jgi:anthranilate phosphoribosyltransferase